MECFFIKDTTAIQHGNCTLFSLCELSTMYKHSNNANFLWSENIRGTDLCQVEAVVVEGPDGGGVAGPAGDGVVPVGHEERRHPRGAARHVPDDAGHGHLDDHAVLGREGGPLDSF